MRCLFIVNPAAGHGRGLERWKGAEADALAAAPGSKVVLTRAGGHAEQLARDGVEEGYEAIVAVGGDGTAAEALNGFLAASERARAACALTTVPAGSGCDLARHLGLDAADALERVLRRPVARRLDAGLVEFKAPEGRRRRYFANVVTAGLGGEVARAVEKSGKRFGALSYLASSAAAAARSRALPVTFTFDGEARPAEPCHLFAVANTSTTGGGMKICPQADPFDGRLDFLSVGALSRAQLLMRLPTVYAGAHLTAPGVSTRRVTRLDARSDADYWLNVDGEAVGRLPASFTALPAAVPFLLPGSL